jgi:ATP-dependent Lhr-like helicase
VLCGVDPVGVEISSRAKERLASARADQWWAQRDATTVVRDAAGKTTWWTFAGWKANLWLGAVAAQAGCRTTVNQVDDLTISLDPDTDLAELRAALAEADVEQIVLAPWITSEAIDGLKFSECLPRQRAVELVARRLADPDAVATARREFLNTATVTSQDAVGRVDST